MKQNRLSSVKSVLNVPDLTADCRYTGNWGYVQLAGIVGSIKWRDISENADTLSLERKRNQVGRNHTYSNINLAKKDVLRGQDVYEKEWKII